MASKPSSDGSTGLGCVGSAISIRCGVWSGRLARARAYSVGCVSGGTGMAAALALAAGLAGSVQAAVMGRFGERIGTLEAVAWASLLSLGLAVIVLLVVRRGVGEL